jgi:hypothetical protein
MLERMLTFSYILFTLGGGGVFFVSHVRVSFSRFGMFDCCGGFYVVVD